MPTFDFSNIVRRITGGILAIVANPVAVLTVALSTLASGWSAVVAFYNDKIGFLTSFINSLQFSLNFQSSDFVQFVGYAIAWDVCVEVWNRLVSFFVSFAVTLIGIIIVTLTVIFGIKIYNAIRRMVTDIGG